jgi:hypothetical protein
MTMNWQHKGRLVAGLILALLGGCSDDGPTNPTGSGGSGGHGGSGGGNPDGGLGAFTPPKDPGKGGVLVTASGESIALTGYPFPPANPDDPQMYDGWDVKFERLLATFDHIELSSTPDKDSGDQSKTEGVAAHVDGPWAVDLHRDGPDNIDGKSPGERAVPIVAITGQVDGTRFATDGRRYAFGFDTIAATKGAMNVNLDADGIADYDDMVQNGCAVMYVGTATFKGEPSCNMGRENWPKAVKFRLCFKTPTSYLNCQNPDNMGEPFPNEESQRGIAFDPNASVIAQVTFHTDHPFWDSVLHESPAHFDQFAARAVGRDGDVPTVTLEDTKGVDYTAYQDSLGNALQWRYCSEPPVNIHPKFTGPMAFDRRRVAHADGDDPKSGLRDYYDFATYNQSTQGHLNADGLCFVKRNYASPP